MGLPVSNFLLPTCRMLWSMPNLASMLLEGLQAQQLTKQQQQLQRLSQHPFTFPQISRPAICSAGGRGLQRNPVQAGGPSPSPLALLAAAAHMADCTVSA